MLQPLYYYIAQVLTMCLPCALPNRCPAMGSPCAFWQPSWISSFYIFWCIQGAVDLEIPKPRQIEHYTNQYTNLSIGFNGKLQIYKIIFKI